ncbi:helix-turn-helix domain-containing protein [Asaia sp. VD9]|uniref:helix-turn-helix domain-containing protein n=1 Tax=Asaia sp. VD9 TaxID=3081235 RepID=UPI00301A3DB5
MVEPDDIARNARFLMDGNWTDPVVDLSVQPSGERRVEFWREIILRLFADVQVSSISKTDFFGTVRSQRFENFRLSSIAASRQTVSRRFREARSEHENRYFAVLMMQGRQVIEQNGHQTILGPGHVAIYDATRPHKLSFEGDWREIVFSIPRPALNNLIVNAEDRVATSLNVSSGVGTVLASYLNALTGQIGTLSETEMVRLAEPAMTMLAMALGGVSASEENHQRVRSVTLLRVKRYIQNHLHDPRMDASMIAAASGLSIRYINKLFATENTSLLRYVLAQRLQRCAEALALNGPGSASIAEIAMRWGFNDVSHFSRSFRVQYGVTPRDWRRRGFQ